ncbi:exocyst complex component 1-like isoform X2 [Zophobas morio]|uniref:exocyst complex component 1-like isoform X2 n=1 Tax=Zophobas morio TaxID=2755281 RepID=UPI0030829F88
MDQVEYRLKTDFSSKAGVNLLLSISALYASDDEENCKVYFCVCLKESSLFLFNVDTVTFAIVKTIHLDRYLIIVLDENPTQKSFNINGEENLEFSLQLDDEVHHWAATEYRAKLNFIKGFVMNSNIYLKVPVSLAHSEYKTLKERSEALGSGAEPETYEELSAQEGTDAEFTIGSDATIFENYELSSSNLKLNRDTLELEVVEILLQSESQTSLMNQYFDDLLFQIDRLDLQLKLYNSYLKDARRDIQKLSKRDILSEIQTRNYKSLHLELSNLVDALNPNEIQQKYALLAEGHSALDNEQGSLQCLEAIRKLSAAVRLSLQSGMGNIQVVEDSIKKLREKEMAFLDLFKQKIVGLVDKMEQTASGKVEHYTLPVHENSYNLLLPFSDFFSMWLRESHEKTYYWLIKYYESAAAGIYQAELRQCTNNLFEAFHSIRCDDASEWKKFNEAFAHILREYNKVIDEEIKFCRAFFGLHVSSESSDKYLRQLLRGILFKEIETNLNTILEFGSARDQMICIQMERVVHEIMEKDKLSQQNFFSEQLAKFKVALKHEFDRVVLEKTAEIPQRGARKDPKRKDNVFSFCLQFEPFLLRVKKALEKASSITGECSTAFVKEPVVTYCRAVFDAVERCAQEIKSKEVCLFENYYHLWSSLTTVKLEFIENFRTEAQAKYKQHIQLYITMILEMPMEKVGKFMAGIKRSLDMGVSETEIVFQTEYSKQNLKKLVESYPSSLVKKVERDFNAESSLFHMVWRLLFDELVQQFKFYRSTIERCYQGLGVDFDFGIEDLYRMLGEVGK